MRAGCVSCRSTHRQRRSCCRRPDPYRAQAGGPMSIATKRGDTGETSLAGAVRASKGHLRVEAYGTVDELNTFMGLARVMTDDAPVKELVKKLQRDLFTVGSALATAPTGSKKEPLVTSEMVEALTAEVHRIEAV